MKVSLDPQRNCKLRG